LEEIGQLFGLIEISDKPIDKQKKNSLKKFYPCLAVTASMMRERKV
jgi:hypothetical protein